MIQRPSRFSRTSRKERLGNRGGACNPPGSTARFIRRMRSASIVDVSWRRAATTSGRPAGQPRARQDHGVVRGNRAPVILEHQPVRGLDRRPLRTAEELVVTADDQPRRVSGQVADAANSRPFGLLTAHGERVGVFEAESPTSSTPYRSFKNWRTSPRTASRFVAVTLRRMIVDQIVPE